jgi:hypothetical protein
MNIIKDVYGFDKGTIAYKYVKTCISRGMVLHPRKFYPNGDAQYDTTYNHLGRACDLLKHMHPQYPFEL